VLIKLPTPIGYGDDRTGLLWNARSDVTTDSPSLWKSLDLATDRE